MHPRHRARDGCLGRVARHLRGRADAAPSGTVVAASLTRQVGTEEAYLVNTFTTVRITDTGHRRDHGAQRPCAMTRPTPTSPTHWTCAATRGGGYEQLIGRWGMATGRSGASIGRRAGSGIGA